MKFSFLSCTMNPSPQPLTLCPGSVKDLEVHETRCPKGLWATRHRCKAQVRAPWRLGPRLPVPALCLQRKGPHRPLSVLYRAQQSLWDSSAPATRGPATSAYLTGG